MSDHLQAIEYRRLVASVASQLSIEEVERITFIRFDKLRKACVCNRPTTGLENEEKASSLHILAALERQGEFSFNNIDGLVEIVKDVNRHDLMGLIESYKKTRVMAKRPKFKLPKRLRRQQAMKPGKPRNQLEEVYEMMVTRFTFLEQQMSLIPRLLEGEGDIQDEGKVVLLSLKYAADELAANLSRAHETFGQQTESLGPWEDTKATGSPENTRDKGRLPRIEEEPVYSQPCLSSFLVRPPIATDVFSPQNRPAAEYEVASHTEEQDFTGDSGFGASSRFDEPIYCVVDPWRRQSPSGSSGRDGPGYMPVLSSSMISNAAYDTIPTVVRKFKEQEEPLVPASHRERITQETIEEAI